MTFDFESLSAKVGPLLRIDLSQEGHGEKKFQKFSQKFVSFRQKMLDFVKKCCLKKFFLHRDLQNFCHVEHQETKKNWKKKFVRRSKIFLKVLLRSVRFSWNHFFSFKTMKNIFFRNGKNLQKTSNWKNNYFNFLQIFHFRKNTISFVNGTA